MSFLQDKCSLFVPNQPTDMHGFSCGDEDLDAFFASDCFAYAKQLLGKTYCYRLDSDKKTIVSAFTLANAGIRVSDLPNSRKKKVEADIPHVKTLKDYPAVLIGRLGVSKDFRSMHVGSDILEYIKYWFFDSNNKTGCRFVIVDAYNDAATKAFYERNGFKTVFSSDEQEKEYRHLENDVHLTTRLMHFDLISLTEDA
ncbi:MAG: GNAT family N-acetyltransferase [Muribaculaceae bacterium]|nr:GNAT family N-acetyltransferase [Muribaculaceae bacterium]